MKKVGYSMLYLMLMLFSLTAQDQVRQLDRMIEADPENLEHRFSRGREFLLQRQDYESAINDFSHVISHAPRHLDARLMRAIALYELGRVDEALRDGVIARDIREVDPRVNGLLGTIFMRMGDYYRAADFFTRQIQLDRGNPQAFINRGWALLMLPGYSEMAIRDYDEALRLSPNSIPALYNRVEPLLHLGRFDEAQTSLNRAIHLEPRNRGLYRRRAFVRTLMHDYERAIADNIQILRLTEEREIQVMAGVMVSVGDLHNRQNAWELGRFFSEMAIILEPDNAQAYINYAEALIGLYTNALLADDLEESANLLKQIEGFFQMALEQGYPSRVRVERRLSEVRLLRVDTELLEGYNRRYDENLLPVFSE